MAVSTAVSNALPNYTTSTNAAVAGGIQGMLGDTGYLNNTLNNWYNLAPQQGALGAYSQYDPNSASQFSLGDANYNADQAKQMTGNASYNQQNSQNFMNPYMSNVIDANNQASNQNLMENVLPQVNSTFAGNGQFGSTRNADFTNRAIRDQQQTLSNTNANALMQAQNQANTLGQQQQQMGINATNTGNQLSLQQQQMGLNAQNAANTQYQNWTQMGNNAGQQDFTNWMTKANYPIGALGTLASSANAVETQPLGTMYSGSDPTTLQKTVAGLGALNTAVNDGTFDWLK